MCVITSDEDSRNRMASRRMVCSGGGGMVAGAIAVVVLTNLSQADGSLTQRGFTPTVLIFSLIAVALVVVSYKSNPERIRPKLGEKITVKQSFSALKGNRPALFAYTAYGIFGYIIYGVIGMFTYYYTYASNDPGLLAPHGIVWALGSVAGSYLIGPAVVKRVPNKKYGMMAGLMLYGVMALIMYFVAGKLGGPVGEYGILFWVVLFIISTGVGIFLSSLFTCFPDIADLGEYNSGIRADGFLSAIASFAIKFGGAFGPTVGSAMLASTGYIANQAQTPETLNAITLNISLIPGVIAIAGAFFITGYNLSTKRAAEIREELERRRTANVNTDE
jgi:Na+/melibiose symporter-like transporter